MKKMLIAVGVMYLCTMPGFAQDSMKSDSSMKQDSTMSGDNTAKKHHKGMGMNKEKTMTGCIEASGDEYMLKTKNGKSMELMSTEDLKPHVGHMVTVTGMKTMGTEKSEGGADKSKNMEAHFKVTKMEMVSETCTMGKKMDKKMDKMKM